MCGFVVCLFVCVFVVCSVLSPPCFVCAVLVLFGVGVVAGVAFVFGVVCLFVVVLLCACV